jgi:chitodextrinase
MASLPFVAFAIALIAPAIGGAATGTPRPTGLTATAASSSAVNLRWTDNSSNERGFEIQRSPANRSAFRKIAEAPPNATTFGDTGLTPATAYKYRIRALKPTTGASSYSNTAFVTTLGGTPPPDSTKPSVPTGLAGTVVSCSQVDLTWNAATDNAGGSGVGSYKLYRDNVLVKTVTAPATSVSDTGLAASRGYGYAVSAVDRANNESAKSAAITKTTPACPTTPVVPTPTNFTAKATSCRGGYLTWNPMSLAGNNAYGIAKFNVYRNNVVIASVPYGGAQYLDSSLAANTSYSYTVSSVHTSGSESPKAAAINVTTAAACPPAAAWGYTTASAGAEQAKKVAVDAAGNLIVTGTFRGTADFGAGPVAASPNGNVFVAKYSPARSLLWLRHVPSSTAATNEVNAIITDGAGNVYVAGAFYGSVDFGGGALVNATAGIRDAFVVKYSSTGAHQWSKRYGSTNEDSATGVAIDSHGDPVFTGQFRGTDVDFGGFKLTNHNGSFGGGDTYVLRLRAADGVALGAFATPCGGAFGYDIALDSADSVLLTGYVRAICDFGSGFQTANNDDAFIVKYSSTGAFKWVRVFGGTQFGDRGTAIAVDAAGDAVVTGSFTGSVNFGDATRGKAGSWDSWGFALKVSGTNGATQWSKAYGPATGTIDYATADGSDIAFDGNGNVTIVGSFRGRVDFGGGTLTATVSNGYFHQNAFVVQYSTSGAHLASNRYGEGTSAQAHGVARGPAGAVVVGFFAGVIDLGFGPVTSGGAAGYGDLFILNTGR